jgi:transposase-like protein
MTSRKLTESDKKEILALYRQPGETTSTLAERYGVSNSTISRLLKNSFSEEEYEALIQQKRGGRSAEPESESTLPQPVGNRLELVSPPSEPRSKPIRRSRRRSSAPTDLDSESGVDDSAEEFVQQEILPIETIASIVTADSDPAYVSEVTLQEILGEDLLDQDDDLDDEDEDEDDLDDLDDEDEEDDEEGDIETPLLVKAKGDGSLLVQVIPLAEASLPRTCYLVVDRSAELIARPLKEFGDLGQIPEDEFQEKTLPVFDNHRVAKRYSNPRTQRVIKLPDSRVLQKTTSHLQAKGITRLLIDGQVYSLN